MSCVRHIQRGGYPTYGEVVVVVVVRREEFIN